MPAVNAVNRLRLRRPSPALIISICALVVAMSGVAIAVPKGSDGVIHACYNERFVGTVGSDVVLVNPGTDCATATGRDFPDAITWNATGPAGATGATGTPGAPGPAGPATPVQPELSPAELAKLEAAKEKAESAQEKVDKAKDKLEDAKAKTVSPAELAAFLKPLQQMVAQLVATQQAQIVALSGLAPNAARDAAIRKAQAQIDAARTIAAKLGGLVGGKSAKAVTREQMLKIAEEIQDALAALAGGQAAVSDGLKATKKP